MSVRVQQIFPTKCPVGTFSPTMGNTNRSACLACTAGWYCPIEAMNSTDGYPCDQGYFCPLGGTPVFLDAICQWRQIFERNVSFLCFEMLVTWFFCRIYSSEAACVFLPK